MTTTCAPSSCQPLCNDQRGVAIERGSGLFGEGKRPQRRARRRRRRRGRERRRRGRRRWRVGRRHRRRARRGRRRAGRGRRRAGRRRRGRGRRGRKESARRYRLNSVPTRVNISADVSRAWVSLDPLLLHAMVGSVASWGGLASAEGQEGGKSRGYHHNI